MWRYNSTCWYGKETAAVDHLLKQKVWNFSPTSIHVITWIKSFFSVLVVTIDSKLNYFIHQIKHYFQIKSAMVRTFICSKHTWAIASSSRWARDPHTTTSSLLCNSLLISASTLSKSANVVAPSASANNILSPRELSTPYISYIMQM